MGRKRKRDSDERILKKLRRLEKKIKSRRHSCDSYKSYSSERSDHENQTNWQNRQLEYETPSRDAYDTDVSPSATSPQRDPTEQDQPPALPSQSEEKDVVIEEVTHLNDEILTLLGDAPKEELAVGPEVHSDIASRLQDVLQNGLKKENKEKIVEDYPIPGNCPLFAAPMLNAEVKAAISDLLQKKDASLAARQRQVGIAMAALVKSMDILVNEKSNTSQQVLKHISGACRLLCDSHYIDTKLRRNFLISTLNNKLKDTLKESKRDKYLFGEDLAEKLKATKAIAKTSQDLRYNKPKAMGIQNRNPPNTNTQSNLNWKHPQPNLQSQSQNRRPAPPHRSAGGPSTSHYRNRLDADSRRRPPAARARASAYFKKRL